MRDAFVRHANGEWRMPPKVYLDAAPAGDFRAMPALGGGLAILKWVTSFPGNGVRGLPVVGGLICVSSAEDGRPLALVDARAVTALRTGAVAAVAAQELGREDARTAGIVGCSVHGAWAGRCLAAAEYGPGVCFDPDPDTAGALAGELDWEAEAARRRSPATSYLRNSRNGAGHLRRRPAPRLHLSMLGADGPGKAGGRARGGRALERLLRRVASSRARRAS